MEIDNVKIDHIKKILGDLDIFWINVKNHEERRINMNFKLESINLKHTRIDAINGSKIKKKEYLKKYNFKKKNINKFEIACSLSHLKAIETAYKFKLDYVIILEDDATFEYFKYHKLTIQNLITKLNEKNGDCLKLACGMRKININDDYFKNSYKNNELFQCKSFNAVAYLLTKNGMKKILDNMKYENIMDVFDNLLDFFLKDKTWFCAPYFSHPHFKDKNNNFHKSTIRKNKTKKHIVPMDAKKYWDSFFDKNYID